MEMFLMVLCLSLLGVGVSAGLFAAATRDERREQAGPLDVRLFASEGERSHFFVTDSTPLVAPRVVHPYMGVPTEVLLLRIERHVRLEQAAAEAFHQFPTIESLHMRTSSPLVH